jgi:hypothetical protein
LPNPVQALTRGGSRLEGRNLRRLKNKMNA